MNKIIILVGESISDLTFQCGGQLTTGLFTVMGCGGSSSKWIHHTDTTSRKCPENDKHPRVYQNYLKSEIDYVLPHWNLLISTNSENTIDVVCNLINEGKLKPEQLIIYGISPDNKEIIFESTLDEEKLYLHNWPYGFLGLGN